MVANLSYNSDRLRATAKELTGVSADISVQVAMPETLPPLNTGPGAPLLMRELYFSPATELMNHFDVKRKEMIDGMRVFSEKVVLMGDTLVNIANTYDSVASHELVGVAEVQAALDAAAAEAAAK